ncbi:MAG TPA: bifunctional molybdenum cofactor biosynthesis protein MoaC/MoaB, partial [Puia sp.]|nr:bifunctional molybdenum cofactor biosynthesis protein MoaC/MoaB [Puia sp.]
MRDITHKQISLRTARAAGIIFCSPETVDLIIKDQLPKGNLFDVARAAGFLGAKSTPQLLPHCHPVTIDEMDIRFEFLEQELHAGLFGEVFPGKAGIVIQGQASSIGRTGIEMEVLMGISIAALEIYDMLKPVDANLEIGHIRLLEKRGGKSDRNRYSTSNPSCAVLVCSDSAAAGQREDKSGRLVKEILESYNGDVKYHVIVPDDQDQIRHKIREWVSEDIQFVFTTGGTGLEPRDNTTEAVRSILEKDADGIAEVMRAYGQMRTPLAMMSRSVAGSIAHTLIVTL